MRAMRGAGRFRSDIGIGGTDEMVYDGTDMAQGTTDQPKLVITIQSQVVHGCVGNTAATFPLRAAGLEVAAVPTAILSNAPIYPTCRGGALPDEAIADLLTGIEERGAMQRAAYLVTGYMGSAAIAERVADFVERTQAQNPDCLYVCDPVLGNAAKGLYVPAELAEIIAARLVPQAHLLTPNQFELGYLARRPVERIGHIHAALTAARVASECRLVVKGCRMEDTPPGALEIICVDGSEAIRIPFEALPGSKAGAGDLFTASLVAGLSTGQALADAARRAQELTGLSLVQAFAMDRPEVVLTGPAFRRALLTSW